MSCFLSYPTVIWIIKSINQTISIFAYFSKEYFFLLKDFSNLFLCQNMDEISDIEISDCDDSIYLRLARMHYDQNGMQKSWDIVKIHDSAATVIYNTDRKVLVFVKQFRPAVYISHVSPEDLATNRIDAKKYPVSKGMTIELCDGIVDKNQSLIETARDEILEECGYEVPLSSLHKITSFRSCVGWTGCVQTLFYAEVTDRMQVSKGGGLAEEGEFIEVIELCLDDAQKLIYDETIARAASVLFGLTWFFNCKKSTI